MGGLKEVIECNFSKIDKRLSLVFGFLLYFRGARKTMGKIINRNILFTKNVTFNNGDLKEKLIDIMLMFLLLIYFTLNIL